MIATPAWGNVRILSQIIKLSVGRLVGLSQPAAQNAANFLCKSIHDALSLWRIESVFPIVGGFEYTTPPSRH